MTLFELESTSYKTKINIDKLLQRTSYAFHGANCKPHWNLIYGMQPVCFLTSVFDAVIVLVCPRTIASTTSTTSKSLHYHQLMMSKFFLPHLSVFESRLLIWGQTRMGYLATDNHFFFFGLVCKCFLSKVGSGSLKVGFDFNPRY